jgi:hypothetical protein
MSPLRAPRLLAALSVFVLLNLGGPRPAVAQLGYAYFQSSIAGTPEYPLRMFLRGPNGSSTEVAGLGFAAGTYTLDSIEVVRGTDCRHLATNVTFTIAAGKVTPVTINPVPTECQVLAGVGSVKYRGEGRVQLLVPTPGVHLPPDDGFDTVVLDCHVFSQGGHFVVAAGGSCAGTFPYGDSVKVAYVADPGSIKAGNGPFSPPPNDTILNVREGFGSYFIGRFQGTDTSFVPAADVADVSITRTGGATGPWFNYTTYTVTNHGPDRVTGLRFVAQLANVASGVNPSIVGWTASIARCGVTPELSYSCFADLDPGASMSLRVALPSVPSTVPAAGATPGFGVRYCSVVLIDHYFSKATDPNAANDSAPCSQDSVTVAVGAGTHMPGAATVTKGAADVPMLAFTLTPTVAPQTLNSITLSASGTGHTHVDVTSVQLYVDANGNGKADPGETAIASGTFPQDTGTVTLAVTPGFSLTGPTDFLVTYSFSLTIAQSLGGGVALAAIPFLFLPIVRRRRSMLTVLLLLVIAGAGVAACGGSDAAGPGGSSGSSTYKADLTGVNISGVDLPGVSVSGPTVTIQK